MPRHVLLVEDEPHIVEAISFLLERDGITVTTHSDGASAANLAKHLAPDLVILDVMLPNKSGLEILREIRSHDTAPNVPVLILTAKGQAKDRAEAEAAGVSMFMTKPFSNRDIVENVKALMA